MRRFLIENVRRMMEGLLLTVKSVAPCSVWLFVVVLSAQCSEYLKFDIPHTWSRRIADKGYWVPNRMPTAIRMLRVVAEEGEDEVFLRSYGYILRCTLPHAKAVYGETILSINVDCCCGVCGENWQEGFVFCRPFSQEVGGVILAPPMEDQTTCKRFPLENSKTPEYFCDYSAQPDRFTVNRYVRTYQDDSQFFVGATFFYGRLGVKVSYGIKNPRGDDVVQTLDYNFDPCGAKRMKGML